MIYGLPWITSLAHSRSDSLMLFVRKTKEDITHRIKTCRSVMQIMKRVRCRRRATQTDHHIKGVNQTWRTGRKKKTQRWSRRLHRSELGVGFSTLEQLKHHFSWWRHQMKTFSALLAICAGNSSVPGEFPAQRPVTQSFDVFCDLRPKKWLSKQSWGWWSETPSSSLWRHRNVRCVWHSSIDKASQMTTSSSWLFQQELHYSVRIIFILRACRGHWYTNTLSAVRD